MPIKHSTGLVPTHIMGGWAVPPYQCHWDPTIHYRLQNPTSDPLQHPKSNIQSTILIAVRNAWWFLGQPQVTSGNMKVGPRNRGLGMIFGNFHFWKCWVTSVDQWQYWNWPMKHGSGSHYFGNFLFWKYWVTSGDLGWPEKILKLANEIGVWEPCTWNLLFLNIRQSWEGVGMVKNTCLGVICDSEWKYERCWRELGTGRKKELGILGEVGWFGWGWVGDCGNVRVGGWNREGC